MNNFEQIPSTTSEFKTTLDQLLNQHVEQLKNAMWSLPNTENPLSKNQVETLANEELEAAFERELRNLMEPFKQTVIESLETATPITATGTPEMAPGLTQLVKNNLSQALANVTRDFITSLDNIAYQENTLTEQQTNEDLPAAA